MEEELPRLEPALQPTMDADEDITSCRDMKENYGPQKQARIDTDFPSIILTNLNCGEHSDRFARPVTVSVTELAADTEGILVMNVSTVATEQSELTPERRRP